MLTARKVHKTHLRKIMSDRGLKAKEVAAILGVQAQTVRAYMCGSRAFSKRQLERVTKAVGNGI